MGGVGVGRELRFTKTELIRKKRQHCLLSRALKSFRAAKQLEVSSLKHVTVQSRLFNSKLETTSSTLISFNIYLLWITDHSSAGKSLQRDSPTDVSPKPKKGFALPSLGTHSWHLLQHRAAGQLLPFLIPLDITSY